MTTIVAIDPGTSRSAWLSYDVDRALPRRFDHVPNDALLAYLRTLGHIAGQPDPRIPSLVVIETIEGMGMAVGAETFETCIWIGRFIEAVHPLTVERITRRQEKLALCGSMRAKDPNVRQALIDRFGGSAAIGRKATPGPLYGISGDVWSALAVAVTWAERQKAAA